jgi:pilus assembly protein CpaC
MKTQNAGSGMREYSVTVKTKIVAAIASGVMLVSLGVQAAPAKQTEKAPAVDTVIEYAPSINVTVGKSMLVKLPVPAARISVANPAVADIRLINSREVYLLGKTVGATNLTLWSKSGRSTLVDVAVGADFAGLQSRLKQILPDETDIHVYAAQETLVLTGTVQNFSSKEKASQLAEAYAGKKVLNYLGLPAQALESTAVSQERVEEGMLAGKVASKIKELLPDENISVAAAAGSIVLHGTVADAVKVNKAVTLAEAYTGKDKVINFLSVGSAQQVMLEVKVAEVSKTLIDQLGGAIKYTDGNFSFLSNFLFGNGLLEALTNPGAGAALGGLVGFQSDSGNTKIAIDAQKKDGLVKILAEPNIMAISGQDGEFHSGGKIFIPVLQGGGGLGTNAFTLEERDFGIRVKFTPTVLEGGRINLRVRPEVSELNPEGTELSAGSVGTKQLLPSFTIRSASTTVQLRDGQSFAIGGLIKNNVKETVRRYPVLGEIPILGALFRSSEFQTDKTELLFVVTPRLVKPLPPDFILPTDSFVEPSRSEFFLGGRMEGRGASPDETAQPAPQSAETPQTAPQGGEAGFEMK